MGEFAEDLDLEQFISLPEAMVKIMANSFSIENDQHIYDERNPYTNLLQEALLYKKVGLNPVFLCKDMKEFLVTSAERVQKIYN